MRQDAAGPDAGADAGCAVHHGRRHDADRSRLCRRGCREYHPEAATGRRLQCRARAARHRLYRRGRQDFAQGRQPVNHPRCVGRGCAAGASQDHGRHCCLGSAAGRTQASAAGIPAGRHDQHPVHLRWRLRRAGQADCRPRDRCRYRLWCGCARPRRSQDWRTPVGTRAGGSDQVRPDSRICRPPAGCGNARGSRRGRADPHPDRAEERADQAVSEAVRDGRGIAGVPRGRASRDRPESHCPQDRRARPAFDHGKHPDGADVRNSDSWRYRGSRDQRRCRG